MKKIIYILAILLCNCNLYAQDKKIANSVKKATEANEIIIEAFKDSISFWNDKYNGLDSIYQIVSKRKFPREISEQELEAELRKVTLKEVLTNADIQKKLSLGGKTTLAQTYLQILNIHKSLSEPYNETTNDENIKLIRNIQPLNCHAEELKTLGTLVNDYRFVMFELARVFKIIDEMSGSPKEIKEKLNGANELDFINKDIPYAQRCLEQYINSRESNEGDSIKQKLLKELIEACPDAFSDFNK